MENATGKLKALVNLNVRKGPGTDYERVNTLKKGSVIEYAGQIENGWVQIDYEGTDCWICTQQKGRVYVEQVEAYNAADDEAEPEEDTTEQDEQPDEDEQDEEDVSLRDTVEELCEGSVTFASQMEAVCRILRDAGFDISSVPGIRLQDDNCTGDEE